MPQLSRPCPQKGPQKQQQTVETQERKTEI